MHTFWEELVRTTACWQLYQEDALYKKVESLNRDYDCRNENYGCDCSFAALLLIVDLTVIEVRPKCKDEDPPEH